METSKYSQLRTALLALSLELVAIASFPALAQVPSFTQKELAHWVVSAEQTHSPLEGREIAQNNPNKPVRFKIPNLGSPRRREGAATRGNCDFTKVELVALLPPTEPVLTAAKYPTFFVALSQTSAKKAEFLLLSDNKERVVYETTVSLPSQPGIISFSLPTDGTLPPLEVGKNYYWQFLLVCDSEDRGKDVIAEGQIQRVKLSSTVDSELKKASPRDRAAIYAEAGIWYDAIASLAQLRRSSPQDSKIAADWTELLESAGLDTITQKPLIPLKQ